MHGLGLCYPSSGHRHTDRQTDDHLYHDTAMRLQHLHVLWSDGSSKSGPDLRKSRMYSNSCGSGRGMNALSKREPSSELLRQNVPDIPACKERNQERTQNRGTLPVRAGYAAREPSHRAPERATLFQQSVIESACKQSVRDSAIGALAMQFIPPAPISRIPWACMVSGMQVAP